MAKRNNSAADLLAELSLDPDFRQRDHEREARQAELEAALKADEEPLVSDLANAGVAVQSVWELVNTNSAYPNAIPILIKHLQEDHLERTKEGIAQALTVAEARGLATSALIAEFCSVHDPDSDFKWVLGAAIAETSTREFVSSILEIAGNKTHGKAREMLPLALLRLPRTDAKPFLQAMMDDADTRVRAVEALKRIGNQ